MAKSPAAKVLKAIRKAKKSEPYGKWEAARERVRELQSEKGEVKQEITRLQNEGLPGNRVISGRYVHEGDHRQIPISSYRRKHERRSEVQAIVDGEDGGVATESEPSVFERLDELQERRELLTEAIDVAEDKADQLKGAAKAAVREATIPVYKSEVLDAAADAMEALGTCASANDEVRDELVSLGFSRSTIPGIAISSYRTDRDGSRGEKFIRDVRNYG